MVDKTELSRRRILQATGGAAATVAVAGCSTENPEDGTETGDGSGDGSGDDGMDDGDDGEDTETETGPQEGGTLELINSAMTTLDPIQSTDTASGRVIQQVYENLTNYPNGVTEIENQLAAEVEVSEDLLTYTFTLEEAQYHNGSELTAGDFVYSFRRLAESSNSQRANFALESGFLGIEHETDEENGVGSMNVVPESLAVEAVDERTFEITLSQVDPAALDILAYDSFGAIPEGYVGDIQGYDGEVSQDEFSTDDMVGTGPFQYNEWVPDDHATLDRFEDYHGENAYLDSINWSIIEDDEAIWTRINERNADVFGIPTAYYDQNNISAETDDRGRDVGTYGPLENGDEVNYLGVAELSTYYVAFNASNTPRSVRRAIAYVTNHQELVNAIFAGRGQEAFSFTPPGMWPEGQDGYQEFADAFPYGKNETDREGAAQVLEEDGYTTDNPYELTLTTYESEVFAEFARLTRDKLSGLGIELEIEQSPFNTLQSRGEDGDLEFYTLGWIWSWSDPAYGLFGFEPDNTDTEVMPEETNGYYLDWDEADSEASQKAQEAWNTYENNPEPDAEDVRTEAFVDIEEARREDMVLLPLYHSLGERFWYDHVHIPKIGSLGGHRQQLGDVWLEQ